MGGNAFAAVLPPSAFPRMPSAVYQGLKARLLPKLEQLYNHVAVPVEAPEKTDHGDLDFIVAQPKARDGSPNSPPDQDNEQSMPLNVPHEIAKATLGAQFANLMEGSRTSNFAVPIARGEWDALGHGQEEDNARRMRDEGGDIFYQVDINVCADKAEWERVTFFHSYGDMGMILGLIVRNAGLTLSTKGLRMPNPPHPPVDLSESFDDIMPFLGLSMQRWHEGFQTKQDLFEWAASTRFFDPNNFRSEGQGIRKVKVERKMYHEFTEWVTRPAPEVLAAGVSVNHGTRKERQIKWQEEALVHFKKKDSFDEANRLREQKAILKEGFNGTKVREWTGLHWTGIRSVMSAVRSELGQEGILKVLEVEGEDGLRRVVLASRERLKIEDPHGMAELEQSLQKATLDT